MDLLRKKSVLGRERISGYLCSLNWRKTAWFITRNNSWKRIMCSWHHYCSFWHLPLLFCAYHFNCNSETQFGDSVKCNKMKMEDRIFILCPPRPPCLPVINPAAVLVGILTSWNWNLYGNVFSFLISIVNIVILLCCTAHEYKSCLEKP